jgi:FkbM family methyltransferase
MGSLVTGEGLLRVHSPDWATIGRPKNEGGGNAVCYRGAYDWTAYSGESLARMESYWDSVVEIFAGLLPERITRDPGAARGINLGTNNGAFQKAWMRRGHPMYGVELYDTIEQLHAYGCEGERASVFGMPTIGSGSFDFAILDRVLGGDSFYEMIGGASAKDGHLWVDPLGNEVRSPVYFDEAFRILKAGGVFFALLYDHWEATQVEDLARRGAATLVPFEANHAWLGVVVDTSGAPTTFRDAQRCVDAAVSAKDAHAMAAKLADMREVYPSVAVLGDRVRFLHLPTNFMVEATTGGEITHHAWWKDTPWRAMIKTGVIGVRRETCLKTDSKRPGTLLLLDEGFSGKDKGEICPRLVKSVAKGCAGLGPVHVPERVIKNTDEAAQVIEQLVDAGESFEDRVVVLGLGRWGSKGRARVDRPKVAVDDFLIKLEALVDRIESLGGRVAVCTVAPIGAFGVDGDRIDEARRELLARHRAMIDSYHDRIAQLAQRRGLGFADLTAVLSGVEGAYRVNPERLSNSGIDAAAESIVGAACCADNPGIRELARARGESVVETVARFRKDVVRRKIPGRFPEYVTSVIGADLVDAGTNGDGTVWVKTGNGRVLHGWEATRGHARKFGYLSDLAPSCLTPAHATLAMDVATRYTSDWSWYDESILPGAGGVIVEVGAYCGYKTVRFADLVGESGLVMGVEMMHENAAMMRRNIEANGLGERMVCVEKGVWNETGETEVYSESTVRNSIVDIGGLGMERRGEVRPVDTLENILKDFAPGRMIDFLDIRVNGAEYEALEGIGDQLSRVKVLFVPVVYEVGGRDRRAEIVGWLERRGCAILPCSTNRTIYASTERAVCGAGAEEMTR